MSFAQGMQLGMQALSEMRQRKELERQRLAEEKRQAWQEEQQARQREEWARADGLQREVDAQRSRIVDGAGDFSSANARLGTFGTSSGLVITRPDTVMATSAGAPSFVPQEVRTITMPGRSDPALQMPDGQGDSPELQQLVGMAKLARTPAELMQVNQAITEFKRKKEHAAVLDRVANLDDARMGELAKSLTDSQIVPGKATFDPKTGYTTVSMDGGEPIQMNRQQLSQYMLGMYKLRSGDVTGQDLIAGVNKDLRGQADSVWTRLNATTSVGNNVAHMAKTDARQEKAATAAANERAETKKEKTDRANAAVALYKQNNPNATTAELEAVRRGIVEAVPKAGNYKVEMGDVSSAFGTPAVDASGKPVADPLTGRQMINRNPDKEQAFFQWMRDNNITDTNKGLALYLGRGQAAPGGASGQTIATDPRAIAIRDDKNLSVEQKREKLKALGYQ
jgi:hypothetical protein